MLLRTLLPRAKFIFAKRVQRLAGKFEVLGEVLAIGIKEQQPGQNSALVVCGSGRSNRCIAVIGPIIGAGLVQVDDRTVVQCHTLACAGFVLGADLIAQGT